MKRTDPPPKPDRCDCCQSAVAELEHFEPNRIGSRLPPEDLPQWFCALCANTMASNSVIYPDQHRESGEAMRTVCYVGNEILHRLRRMQS